MLTAAIIAILITMFLALVRAFKGPSEYDRMLAANSFGTKTVLLIALAGYLLSWNSFLDVALLYAMVNFVGTIAVMRFFELSVFPGNTVRGNTGRGNTESQKTEMGEQS